MRLVKVMVKEKVFNILVALVSLLHAGIAVASSQQRVLNTTVTRTPGTFDSFTFRARKLGNKCLTKTLNICVSSGGVQKTKPCETKELCCESCQCVQERPTFLVHEQRCVDDRNITQDSGLSKSGYRFVLDFPDATCQSQSLATLNTTAPGERNFSICTSSNHRLIRCTTSPKDSKYLDHNGRWADFDAATRRAVEHVFSTDVLKLKWKATSKEKLLQGGIMSLDVTCYQEMFFHTSMQEIPIKSRLLFKMAGSQVWQGSKVVQEINKPTNQSGGLVVMPTTNTVSIATVVHTVHTVHTSPATNEKEKLNFIHVPGKVDMILVVVAAVLGTLLFIAVTLACAGVVFLVMRKKKKVSLGANNPLYERGPDMTLVENRGSRQTSIFSANFYQPLVENTREPYRNQGEPIYQSLDGHGQANKPSVAGHEENPNRCSLAYCDMTADGYLIPTDGHRLPEPPTTPVSRENVTDESYLHLLPDKKEDTEDQSLNYKYNKPEEILADHSPTISLKELPSELESDQESNYDDVNVVPQQKEQAKEPFYHEFENASEATNAGKEEKRHCKECKGTIGNYGVGEDSKPVRCLCDVTTKL